MKVKILKKTIKEGESYCIKALFVSVDNRDDANELAMSAAAAGATKEAIAATIRANEYDGVTTYAFSLNCSHYTFDRVERYGILDAKINFVVNGKGFCNAKIPVIDKKEQIFGYTPPESEVKGWEVEAPEPKTAEHNEEQPQNLGQKSAQHAREVSATPSQGVFDPPIMGGPDDLPF